MSRFTPPLQILTSRNRIIPKHFNFPSNRSVLYTPPSYSYYHSLRKWSIVNNTSSPWFSSNTHLILSSEYKLKVFYSTLKENDQKIQPAPEEKKITNEVVKKPLSQRVKEEIQHYWHGTKLLAKDTQISTKLVWKLLQGSDLTRREQRQLRRTMTDLFRLVPFLIFVIIPFMEFLLPFALKLFPNMLPSTYQSKKDSEEKKRKLYQVRLEMAGFLQETISETLKSKSSKVDKKSFEEIHYLFHKIRSSGDQAGTEDLIKISKLLEDEITLDNLSRPQLVSMCKYMGVQTFGTDNILKFQIRNKMKYLKADDRMINTEGVDSLTIPELQSACQARGIKTVGMSPARLRSELRQWLDLHLVHQVPSSILMLSRAFVIGDADLRTSFTPEILQATLSSLPDSLVSEAELKLSEEEGVATHKQRLEVIKQQQEMIADEEEQQKKDEQSRKDEEAKKSKKSKSLPEE